MYDGFMAQKKRVLLAITQSNFGGAQRYVYDLARSLPKDQFDVEVVCGGRGLLKEKLAAENIPVTSIPALERNFSFSDIRAFFQILTFLKQKKPDILHANSSKAGGLFMLAGRIVGIQSLIFTAHGWEFNAPRPLLQKMIIRLLSWCIVLLSHHTIAVSSKVKKQMSRFDKKITVIHNGIQIPDHASKNDARSHVSRILNIETSSSELWLGTVAELHPVKGLSYAIEAFATIAKSNISARYIIIGDGLLKQELESQIEELGLTNHVHLAGFVDNVPTLLKAFDIFVLPSISEGLAYAILEAGAASLPVIASNTGGIPEVIDSSSGILVPVGNVDEIKNAEIYLLNNPADRSRLGTALNKKIIECFSLEIMSKQTCALYSKQAQY